MGRSCGGSGMGEVGDGCGGEGGGGEAGRRGRGEGGSDELGPGPDDDDFAQASVALEDLKKFMAKLVLGNDFSGGVHGDSRALTVSLAITNLAAGAFGEMKRLLPVAPQVEAKWRRELEWYICILKSPLYRDSIKELYQGTDF
jgi:hypothetical protein